MLKIAKDLSLPLDVAGQAIALVGIRGAGKTNTAGVIAEELLERRTHPLLWIDPTDASWGLRSGYPVFIFGGPHGDLPLNETDGKVIAEFVVNERVPLIVSIRHLRKAAQRRFVTELFEELYHLKGKPENRTPLTVIIDEAPLFVPQKVMGEVARTVGAVEDLIARGRNTGFGVILIGQRPATINKDVLSQADTIITHRITSPHDRKALRDWIEENASIEKQHEVLSSLATLKDGEAWVWAPMFGVFKRVQIRRRHTFDSSATPKMGEKIRAPKDLTTIDIDKLKGKLAATMEKAKADDPRELRKQLAEAQRMLVRQEKTIGELQARAPAGKEKRVEVPVLKDAQIARVEKLVERFGTALDVAMKQHAAICEPLQQLVSAVHTVRRQQAPVANQMPSLRSSGGGVRPIARTDRPVPRAVSRPVSIDTAASNGNLGGPEIKILTALAELEALGLHPADKQQLGLLAGYTNVRSGGFSEPMGRLMRGGYAESPITGKVALTAAGRAAAGEVTPPQSSDELQMRIMGNLKGPEQKLLRELLRVYPERITKEALGEACGYTNIRSGGFSEPLGRLHTLGLVDTPVRGEVVAAAALFLEG